MTTIDPVRLLFASDLHFGDKSINQEEMANAFVRTILPLLEQSDIFFINGDFFDDLVNFDHYGFDPIYETIMAIMAWCQKHNVVLRILQGTWEHDHNQCKRWNTFYKRAYHTFDFRYMEGIEFEEITIRDRTLRIMYVQDNLPYTTSDEIVAVIESKLRELGWDYVDYGCMHGFFDFTFPANIKQDKVVVFKEAQFPFVRKMIDVGHVHQHRIVGNVVSNGSFDRLNHGDEDPKGCIRVLDYPDHYTASFVKNEHAAIYDTLVIDKDATTEQISAQIAKHVNVLISDRKISLRFIVETAEQVSAIKSWMKEVYPNIAVAFKKRGDVEDKSFILSSSTLFTALEDRIAPTPATIGSFVRNHIPESYIMSVEDIDRYLLPIVR